jgi:hypothetical protein
MKIENGSVNSISRTCRKFVDKSAPTFVTILLNDWQTGDDFETATTPIVLIPCRSILFHWAVSRVQAK